MKILSYTNLAGYDSPMTDLAPAGLDSMPQAKVDFRAAPKRRDTVNFVNFPFGIIHQPLCAPCLRGPGGAVASGK